MQKRTVFCIKEQSLGVKTVIYVCFNTNMYVFCNKFNFNKTMLNHY